MAAGKDKRGRPVVVVTGLGVMTSLGAGKSDNWAKLTGGESGIKAITRFPTDGLKTRIAGTIDYLPPQDTAAALTESIANLAAEEAISQSGLGPTGSFPGPLFSPSHRSRWNGHSGLKSAQSPALMKTSPTPICCG
jgi:3-oxoacyl-[acyl-carrier-protein] synthase II